MTNHSINPEQRQFAIQRIYLKDVSFEAPNAPAIFREEWRPDNSLTINTKVSSLEADAFEVVLSVTLTAKAEERTIYVVEVQQAGIFTLTGFPETERSHLLGAFCPNTLFAYAREAISDLVTKGSFPQVVLQPVNFEALFLQHQQNATKNAPNGGKRPTLN
jgi:preprotein translocase subunit SecB